MSVMLQDMLTTYKYGWKTSYYQNTYDFKTDEVVDTSSESQVESANKMETLVQELLNAEEEACESCTI